MNVRERVTYEMVDAAADVLVADGWMMGEDGMTPIDDPGRKKLREALIAALEIEDAQS